MKVENSGIFRNNVSEKFIAFFEKKKAINIEKGIYNFTVRKATKLNIVRKWENKFFVILYLDRVKSLFINFKNNNSLVKKIKKKKNKYERNIIYGASRIVPGEMESID